MLAKLKGYVTAPGFKYGFVAGIAVILLMVAFVTAMNAVTG